MSNLCVVTATRAEYGLLKPLMQAIKKHSDFHLQLLVTGAHLSHEFGYTFQYIEKDGFEVDAKVEMLLSADSATSIVKSMGLGMLGYGDAFDRLSPDAIIILGDRYEMLAVASAAAVLKIPIIHLHGGELTEGAYDDAFRHAITKLSHLHFTATDVYRQRVVQMGEQPEHVYNVGAIGMDNVRNLDLLSRDDLERDLGITFMPYNYQVTFHPETLSSISVEKQFEILLKVLKSVDNSLFIFTKANADTSGRVINKMIDEFVLFNPQKAIAFSSLGTLRFLSLLNICNAIIGNSSSGIIEAPFLGIATINIGDRQKGRIQAPSIINCKVDEIEIHQAIQLTMQDDFKSNLDNIDNPYGVGDTTNQIIKVLENVDFKRFGSKQFFNF